MATDFARLLPPPGEISIVVLRNLSEFLTHRTQ